MQVEVPLAPPLCAGTGRYQCAVEHGAAATKRACTTAGSLACTGPPGVFQGKLRGTGSPSLEPKFDRYLSLEVRRRLLHDLDASALWVEIPAGLGARTWSRDSTDDVFIQTALAANVRRLITGDQDLLILHPLGDLHLLSPRAALDGIAGMQAPL